jgi:hypothetical protein
MKKEGTDLHTSHTSRSASCITLNVSFVHLSILAPRFHTHLTGALYAAVALSGTTASLKSRPKSFWNAPKSNNLPLPPVKPSSLGRM